MNDMRRFEHTHSGITFVSQLAMPPGPGPHPGIMVMHDGQGVGDFVCRKARDLAALGYAALATDMFGNGKRHTDPAESTPVVLALRKEGAMLRDRVAAAFAAFKTVPGVDANRIGAIGYCFGGQCVLELARSGAEARAVVSFHGSLGSYARTAAPGTIKARILALTGAQDPFAPAKAVAGFQEEMTAAGAEWHMTIYGGAKHGFTDPVSDEMAATMPGVGYDPLADRLSWAQALAFLDAALHT